MNGRITVILPDLSLEEAVQEGKAAGYEVPNGG